MPGVVATLANQVMCSHGGQAKPLLALGCCRGFADQRIGQTRLETGVFRTTRDSLRKQTFKRRIERHDLHLATAREELLDDGTSQCDAHLGRKFVGILGTRRMIRHRFDDGPHIADVHAFLQHSLQYLL